MLFGKAKKAFFFSAQAPDAIFANYRVHSGGIMTYARFSSPIMTMTCFDRNVIST